MDARSFRDCQAWRAEGLPLSTTSNEACKLYDAILHQLLQWRNDETLGGFEGCMKAVKVADPNFVLGNVLCTGIELIGTATCARINPRLAEDVKYTLDLAKSQVITPRESLHVKAMEFFSQGNFTRACSVWEDILVDHPTDLLALKFAHDGYFYMGSQVQLRDSVARVLPHWKPHMPLAGYLNGLYSFGLLENRLYDQAEKVAMEGLALHRDDAWSVHSIAHVCEMKSAVDKGLKFMESRENDWQRSDVLASHNYWHWALYFVEKGEYEAALQIFDSQIFRRCKMTGSMLDTVDASSLLYRLEMEGVCVKDRYRELFQVTKPHSDDHVTIFNDLHFLMVSLGAKEKDNSRHLVEGLRDLANNAGDNEQHQLAGTLGMSMCKAMMEYEDGNYSNAVDALSPVRYQMLGMGGSDAQRDVFNLLLIHSALKSDNKQHNKLGRCLLVERDAYRPNSLMTNRLMQRALALHV